MKYRTYILYGSLVVGTVVMATMITPVLSSITTFLGYQVPYLLQYIAHYNGPEAMACYALLFILMITCALPVTALMTIVGGALFGALPALCLATLSTAAGGALSYRAFKTGWGIAQSWILHHRVQWLIHYVGPYVRIGIIMGRLIPVIPFAAVTAMAACSQLSVREFTLISTIGILPQLILYSLIGQYAGQLALLPSIYYQASLYIGLPIATIVLISWFFVQGRAHTARRSNLNIQ